MEERRPPNQPTPPSRPQRTRRNAPMLLLMLGLITIVILVFSTNKPKVYEPTWTQLNEDIRLGKVDKLHVVGGQRVWGTYKENIEHELGEKEFEFRYTGTGTANLLTAEKLQEWAQTLDEKGGEFVMEEGGPGLVGQILSWLPWLFLFFLIWFLVFRQMRAVNGSGVMQFGRSR
ncbi:MAG: hypothetical protein ACYTG6_13855, partial [Planctomycetota bacterium]